MAHLFKHTLQLAGMPLRDVIVENLSWGRLLRKCQQFGPQCDECNRFHPSHVHVADWTLGEMNRLWGNVPILDCFGPMCMWRLNVL